MAASPLKTARRVPWRRSNRALRTFIEPCDFRGLDRRPWPLDQALEALALGRGGDNPPASPSAKDLAGQLLAPSPTPRKPRTSTMCLAGSDPSGLGTRRPSACFSRFAATSPNTKSGRPSSRPRLRGPEARATRQGPASSNRHPLTSVPSARNTCRHAQLASEQSLLGHQSFISMATPAGRLSRIRASNHPGVGVQDVDDPLVRTHLELAHENPCR